MTKLLFEPDIHHRNTRAIVRQTRTRDMISRNNLATVKSSGLLGLEQQDQNLPLHIKFVLGIGCSVRRHFAKNLTHQP